jgi:hypothetical protein
MISLLNDREIYGNKASEYLRRIDTKTAVINGCWQYNGQHTNQNVAMIKVRQPRTNLVLARFIWCIFHPEFDYYENKERVLHTCDNDMCWNLNHLWIGSYSDNMVDMYAKGRHRRVQPQERF